jgi:choline dehydrogenase-like flavoprotein
MLIDARELAPESTVDTDLCVIGAGAAGLTLAHELAGAPFRICLLEGGGRGPDRWSQALLAGETVGHPYFRLDETRQAGIGGTTSIWAGMSRPLDALDLEGRDWVPGCGWPLGRAALDPYYKRAHSILQLGPFEYEPGYWESPDARRLPLPDSLVQTVMFQVSPPTRFGDVYFPTLQRAPNITTIVHANAAELISDAAVGPPNRVLVRTRPRHWFSVTARLFVLATGGIENARLLLASRSVHPMGLGNTHDLVGRFFMEHLCLNAGVLAVAQRQLSTSLYSVRRVARGAHGVVKVEAALAPNDALARQDGLVRVAMHFPHAWRAWQSYESPGVGALIQLVRAVRQRRMPYRAAANVRQVLRHLDAVLVSLAGFVGNPYLPRRRLIARTFAEQTPDRENRVTLADTFDALDRPFARLTWRVGERELRTIRRFHQILRSAARESGAVRFDTTIDRDNADWPASVSGGYHHMGTTRMHQSPRRGVVDADCRVHGVENLFVAGSSVFPTAGYSNPTLTIVALALRLADQLRAEFAVGQL